MVRLMRRGGGAIRQCRSAWRAGSSSRWRASRSPSSGMAPGGLPVRSSRLHRSTSSTRCRETLPASSADSRSTVWSYTAGSMVRAGPGAPVVGITGTGCWVGGGRGRAERPFLRWPSHRTGRPGASWHGRADDANLGFGTIATLFVWDGGRGVARLTRVSADSRVKGIDKQLLWSSIGYGFAHRTRNETASAGRDGPGRHERMA